MPLCAALIHRQAAPSVRKERKIRGLEEYFYFFESSGDTSIDKPLRYENAEVGDLFVHTHGPDRIQMWIRVSTKTWDSVGPGHRHPYLPGYRLVLTGGKPGWVTRKTVATYHYRSNVGA